MRVWSVERKFDRHDEWRTHSVHDTEESARDTAEAVFGWTRVREVQV